MSKYKCDDKIERTYLLKTYYDDADDFKNTDYWRCFQGRTATAPACVSQLYNCQIYQNKDWYNDGSNANPTSLKQGTGSYWLYDPTNGHVLYGRGCQNIDNHFVNINSDLNGNEVIADDTGKTTGKSYDNGRQVNSAFSNANPTGEKVIDVRLLLLPTDTNNELGNGKPGGLYKFSAPRVEGKNVYNKSSLFIINIKRVPEACGAWPAFWAVGMPDSAAAQWGKDSYNNPINMDWPNAGEIDMIELVNGIHNHITLHTKKKCNSKRYVDGNEIKQPGQATDSNAYGTNDCNDNDGKDGCGVTAKGFSGTDINKINKTKDTSEDSGCLMICEWRKNCYINVWMLKHSEDPKTDYYKMNEKIKTKQPIKHSDLTKLPKPSARHELNNCRNEKNEKEYFNNLHLVLNTTICGQWSGQQLWNTDNQGECNIDKYLTNLRKNSGKARQTKLTQQNTNSWIDSTGSCIAGKIVKNNEGVSQCHPPDDHLITNLITGIDLYDESEAAKKGGDSASQYGSRGHKTYNPKKIRDHINLGKAWYYLKNSPTKEEEINDLDIIKKCDSDGAPPPSNGKPCADAQANMNSWVNKMDLICNRMVLKNFQNALFNKDSEINLIDRTIKVCPGKNLEEWGPVGEQTCGGVKEDKYARATTGAGQQTLNHWLGKKRVMQNSDDTTAGANDKDIGYDQTYDPRSHNVQVHVFNDKLSKMIRKTIRGARKTVAGDAYIDNAFPPSKTGDYYYDTTANNDHFLRANDGNSLSDIRHQNHIKEYNWQIRYIATYVIDGEDEESIVSESFTNNNEHFKNENKEELNKNNLDILNINKYLNEYNTSNTSKFITLVLVILSILLIIYIYANYKK